MKHIPQENLMCWIDGLIEDALKAFREDRPEEGYKHANEAYEYLSIFLGKDNKQCYS